MKISELVNEHFDELSANDIHIWNYIQAHPKECTQLSINELAQRCHVSKTTILRFSQKLSLKGYSELKVYLNWEAKPNKNMLNDDELVENVCNTCTYAIDEIRDRDFGDICAMLYQAKRIFVYGTGALQNSVANEIQRMFLYCGEFIYVMAGEKETEMILPHIQPDDLLILISLRGEGEVINTFASALRLKNIPTISITKLKNNELAHKCTKSIYITTSEVMIGDHILHEAANLFFILAEVLFLRYSQYKRVMDIQKEQNEMDKNI